MMKSIFLYILIAGMFCSCNNSEEERFLENFIDKEKYNPNSPLKRKEIDSEYLNFLNKSEAVNEFESESGKKYYYGYKTKISDDCYILTYGYQFHIDNNFHPFALGIAGKSYVCIYQKGIGIISKIKVVTSDTTLTSFVEKEGVYTIKSISSYLKYDETKRGFFPYNEKDTITTKYKIKNNRFVEVK